MANVLAYLEVRDAAAGKTAREVMTVARSIADALGGEAHGVAVGGPGTETAAAGLAEFGADRLHIGEREDLGLYQPDVAASAVAALAGGAAYGAVLFPSTAQGKDLAPRVAAKLGRGIATEVIAWEIEDDAIVVRRPVYSGKAIATLRFTGAPALLTIRSNVFPPVACSAAGDVSALELDGAAPRARVTALEQGDRDRIDVSEATIVVSGGRGMQGPENWHLLEDLVVALGEEAALGASRAVVDAGWRPHGEQVGQTGKTVAPDLYFAVGISGAIQHMAGMRTAKVIVAVNRDSEAPIFSVADYGIVGDVFDILPALSTAVRAARQEG